MALAGCLATWSGSVGAVLGKDNRTGRVFVRQVPAGMAAARAGLLEGDELVAIDGVSVLDLSAGALHEKLVGAVGSKVSLTVRRPGAGPREVTVERGPLRGEPGPE